MTSNRNNFFGLGIVPSTTTTNSVPGDIEYLTSDGKLHIRGVSVNDSVVLEALAATLTNKSISGATNTLTAIPNTALTNSSITINGASVSLGGSTTVSATATNALTIGTGLTGTSYNGSTAVTVAIDSTVVTLTGTQTLTNKTLTSAVLNTPTADTITGIGGNLALTAATSIVLTSAAIKLANLQVSANTLSDASNGGLTLTSGNAAFGINLNATGTAAIQFQRSGTQVAFIDTGVLTLVNQNSLKLNDGATGSVSLKAPASVPAAYTITLPSAPPATGTALVWNGTSYVWSTVSSGYSVVTQTINDATAITLTANSTFQTILVAGTTAPATSSGLSGTVPNGAMVRLIGTNDVNPVTINNSDVSGGTIVNGNAILRSNNSIDFQYISSQQRYIECSRNF